LPQLNHLTATANHISPKLSHVQSGMILQPTITFESFVGLMPTGFDGCNFTIPPGNLGDRGMPGAGI